MSNIGIQKENQSVNSPNMVVSKAPALVLGQLYTLDKMKEAEKQGKRRSDQVWAPLVVKDKTAYTLIPKGKKLAIVSIRAKRAAGKLL
jgi:hypothetical protein